MVVVLATLYGVALASYFVGLVVFGVRMRQEAGVRGFWTAVPDVLGWRAALEGMVLLALWPLTHNRRAAWIVKQTDRQLGS